MPRFFFYFMDEIELDFFIKFANIVAQLVG